MASVASSCSSAIGDDDDVDDDKWIKPPMLPLTVERPSIEEAKAKATPRCCTSRMSRDVIWENNYFYLAKGQPADTGLRVRVRSGVVDASIGRDFLSKYITPSQV